ncbi:MAG: rRNA methyltransferase, partial [Acidobacteria bacterium]|nr:rRNA methyltransferase [Acidobacteriota bacterium]
GRASTGLPPRATFPALRKRSASGDVALVFGPERSGLTTPEVRLCDELVALPTRPEMTTLSLPQALTATLALLAVARPPAEDRETATRAELARLHEVLSSGGFPRPGQEGPAAELQAFWKRARPTSREVALLLGALESLRKR